MRDQHERTLAWAETVRQVVEKGEKPKRTRKSPAKPKKTEPRKRADGVSWEDWSRRANEPEGRTTGLHRDSMG